MKPNSRKNALISDLLSLWYAWGKAVRVGTGYYRASPGFNGYIASRQYDDQNGALDVAADMEMAKAVDEVIQKMQDPWRTALHVEARNISVPNRLWATARIDLDELKRVTQEARGKLWDELGKAGLL